MTPDDALAFVAARRLGVLVTLRRDGRPQTSNVVYAVRDRDVLVSVTADRAKTRNLARDPRAALHVSEPDGSAWAAVDGPVELTPVAAAPGDATCRLLTEVYEAVAGQPHPDPADFDRAMVEEQRLVAVLHVGHGWGGGASSRAD